MAKPKKVRVSKAESYRVCAGANLKMPLPRWNGIDGVRVLKGVRPQVFTPETVIEVADSPYVRGRLEVSDMVVTKKAITRGAAAAAEPKAKKEQG